MKSGALENVGEVLAFNSVKNPEQGLPVETGAASQEAEILEASTSKRSLSDLFVFTAEQAA